MTEQARRCIGLQLRYSAGRRWMRSRCGPKANRPATHDPRPATPEADRRSAVPVRAFVSAIAFAVLLSFGFASALYAQSPPRPVRGVHDSAPLRRSPARTITRTSRSPSDDGRQSTRPGSGSSPWTPLGALGLVIGLIVVLGRVWKKHGPTIAGGAGGESIEILGRRGLNSRQAIYLVRLGSRILVLGSTANDLRTLTEITDAVEVDYLAGLCRTQSSETISHAFRSLFAGATSTGRRNGEDVRLRPASSGGVSADEVVSSVPLEEEARV